MSSARIIVQSERLDDVATVTAKLETQADHGWICYASGWKAWWPGGDEASRSTPEGFPLSAELRLSNTRSAQLRQLGDGWLWTVVDEADSGDEVRVWPRAFISTLGSEKLQMSYRCYWRRGEPAEGGVQELRPYAARFIGFEPEESKR